MHLAREKGESARYKRSIGLENAGYIYILVGYIMQVWLALEPGGYQSILDQSTIE